MQMTYSVFARREKTRERGGRKRFVTPSSSPPSASGSGESYPHPLRLPIFVNDAGARGWDFIALHVL